MTKIRLVVLLVSAIALILVLLALQLLSPGDSIIETGPNNAHIVFSADQGMTIAPGRCVIVRWRVDHIQAVYLDDQPVVGQGSKQICPDDQTMPILRVSYTDNTSAEFSLNFEFLVEQPSTWLLFGTGVLLGCTSLLIALIRPSLMQQGAASWYIPRGILIFSGLGVLVVGVVLVLFIAELGVRFYFARFGTETEQTAYLDSRDQIKAPNPELMALPLVEAGLRPGYPGQNALGYRGDAIQIPKPSGVFRIVAVGDSTTYGSYLAYDQSYPYDLQTLLRETYGYPQVEVVNGGVPLYDSWNMVVDLAFRIPELQPDLVIIYDGWNDLLARQWPPDCYSGLSPYLGLGSNRYLRVIPDQLSPFGLYRMSAIKFGWMQNPALSDENYIRSSLSCGLSATTTSDQNVQANRPTYFERNTREMIAIAKAEGFRIMFMTWAYDPNDPHLIGEGRTAIAEHNAITTRVAQENDALVFDYAAVAPSSDSEWNDVAHPNVQGSLEQAKDVAQFLVDHHVIPPG